MSSFSMNLGDPVGAGGRPLEEGPLRIAILGDFSGRQNRGQLETGAAIASRRIFPIDRDNVEETLQQLGVRIVLPAAAEEQPFTFEPREIDDFHPDALFQSCPLFDWLRRTRRRLVNPASFAEAAAEVRGWAGIALTDKVAANDETATDQRPAPDQKAVRPENLLEQMLDETERTGTAQLPPRQPDWNALLREIAEPYCVPGADPQQAELVACVDEATAKLMAALLHGGDFQPLEAAWRGIDLLVRRVETDAKLKLYLVDISKEELSADLQAGAEVSGSGMFNLLVEQTVGTPGAEPWAALVGHFEFDDSPSDVALLGCLARVARSAGAPFVAAARGSVVGCPHPEQTPDPDQWQEDEEARQRWDALRQLPEAASLGLIWPRFLLRLPYGSKTNPIEAFDFEEQLTPQHEDYLWGNSALVWAILLGQAFRESGWDLRLRQQAELGNLPLHVYEEDGVSHARPCGELLLSDRGASRARDRGLCPLVSVRDRDTIRLPAMISLAGEPLGRSWKP